MFAIGPGRNSATAADDVLEGLDLHLPEEVHHAVGFELEDAEDAHVLQAG
ncbi:MAG: hypothetical protein MZU95_08120 [Desulfomicrobium escambiense]|nr:hypothetical protein [Desulfomicrobium escambiense]